MEDWPKPQAVSNNRAARIFRARIRATSPPAVADPLEAWPKSPDKKGANQKGAKRKRVAATQHIAFQPVEFFLLLGYCGMLLGCQEIAKKHLAFWVSLSFCSLLALQWMPPQFSFHLLSLVALSNVVLLSLQLGYKAILGGLVYGALLLIVGPTMELPFFVSWSGLLACIVASTTIRELELERRRAGGSVFQQGFFLFAGLALVGAVVSFLPNAVGLTVTSLGISFLGLGYYARRQRAGGASSRDQRTANEY